MESRDRSSGNSRSSRFVMPPRMKGHVMSEPSECTRETLISSLAYLQHEASLMELHFEAHLIGVAALAMRDTLESRRNSNRHNSLVVSTIVSKILH